VQSLGFRFSKDRTMYRARLDAAAERIQFARKYTSQFLGDLTDGDWFWTPPGFVTHIAWQVAHIASSQYGLCLFRLRGRLPADEQLIPQDFWDKFKIGSTPVAGAENNPPLAMIRQVFDNMQAQVLSELAAKTDEEVDVPLEKLHPAFTTVLGGIEYSPLHELIHVGQITLLRRQMGKPSLR
jgi:hypothetical protein